MILIGYPEPIACCGMRTLSKAEQSADMLSLPVELQHKIITNLSTHDLVQLRKTCRRLGDLCGPYILKRAIIELNRSLFLHLVVKDCLHGILSSLLELDAPVHNRDRQGETALHWAARKGCMICVVQLLVAGAAPDTISTHGWTPLMLAARFNHIVIAKELISIGADVNHRGFHGWTALHLAYRSGHGAMAALLSSAGGDEKLLDNDGLCPSETCFKQKCWGVLS